MELPIKKMCISKINTKEKKKNKVSETKTVENNRYEPILSWSSDFIYRGF